MKLRIRIKMASSLIDNEWDNTFMSSLWKQKECNAEVLCTHRYIVKHNGNFRIWHFDLLEMAWNQPQTHLVGLMQPSHVVLWMNEIIFLNKIDCIMIQISPKSVLKGSIEMTLTLGQGMAWCWIGNKQLLEPMMVRFTDAYIHMYHHASMS